MELPGKITGQEAEANPPLLEQLQSRFIFIGICRRSTALYGSVDLRIERIRRSGSGIAIGSFNSQPSASGALSVPSRSAGKIAAVRGTKTIADIIESRHRRL